MKTYAAAGLWTVLIAVGPWIEQAIRHRSPPAVVRSEP